MDNGINKDEWMVIEREVCMLVKNTMGKDENTNEIYRH
jgi:hypothetical protein